MDLEGLPEVTRLLPVLVPFPPGGGSPAEPVKTNVVELEQEAVDEWKAELSIADNLSVRGCWKKPSRSASGWRNLPR